LDRVIGTGAGYYIDVAAALEERQQESLDDAPELYAARAVIEHAKGALMLDGINAEQAFRVLAGARRRPISNSGTWPPG
jgi:hypothetical protein